MSPQTYRSLLLGVAGLGGFLYGYDIGIIGAALLYLNKTIQLTASQESLVVAAVLAGGTVSSLVAGALADVIGRKRLMVAAGVVFLASVAMIVAAHGFAALLSGRTLQGLSAGMIAVVIPLYLAESLPAAIRGRGTACFQLFLTLGILIAMAVGRHYTAQVETASGATADALRHAQDGAWRAMFLSAAWPGALFLAGALLVTESPRWLLRRGRVEAARAALVRSRQADEAENEFVEMQASLADTSGRGNASARPAGSLWQRRYVVPFVLTCTVLALTQTTGINSILQFLVVMLQKAGLGAEAAAARATWVTAVNVAFTVAGLVLVDRLGRKRLLQIGTAVIAVSLVVGAFVFWRLQSGAMAAGESSAAIVAACLMLFVAGFATGPGVCVWLALSELMPTRIRSLGMGIGLLINQGVSTVIAAMFLPVVERYGYAAMFTFWAACTVGYFLVATLWLPETKGRTLEEIEAEFAARTA
jgi:SP family myo-inositol transporter-like MFS transporter 13